MKINSDHVHTFPRSKVYKFKAVREYLKDIPNTVSTSCLKKIVCQQFSITEKQFYYNNTLAKNSNISFE